MCQLTRLTSPPAKTALSPLVLVTGTFKESKHLWGHATDSPWPPSSFSSSRLRCRNLISQTQGPACRYMKAEPVEWNINLPDTSWSESKITNRVAGSLMEGFNTHTHTHTHTHTPLLLHHSYPRAVTTENIKLDMNSISTFVINILTFRSKGEYEILAFLRLKDRLKDAKSPLNFTGSLTVWSTFSYPD